MVFQVPEYGVEVSSAPRLRPSSLNWTPTTPVLSVAEAESGTEPDMVVPWSGVVMETVGEVVSGVGGGGGGGVGVVTPVYS